MVLISDNAARQILKMLAKNGLEGGGLRVGLKAGGCSGYEYVFAGEREPRATDPVFDGPPASRGAAVARAPPSPPGPGGAGARSRACGTGRPAVSARSAQIIES